MAEWLKRSVVATWLRATGRPRRNRERYWQNSHGLRLLTAHAGGAAQRERLYCIVEWCGEHFDLAEPGDVDDLVAGRFQAGQRDKILFTFDDGHERFYPVAEWLARKGIKATFFVIPCYIGRTVRQFMQYHQDNGVEAYNISQVRSHDQVRGLSRSEIAEMVSMGHRIAAHNFAHRDLGTLHQEEDLEYEIGRAIDMLSTILESECQDFAWAFGNIKHISEEATHYLQRHCPRVYASIRGLNVGGLSPAFLLRDGVNLDFPPVFSKLCLEGGADDRWEAEREELQRRVGCMPQSQQSPTT
ncbi:MAG: polysaccharide deacetylase family protein [Planctomycetota bacterium]